jgi:NitT/TauT family transport system ATP-binding protein
MTEHMIELNNVRMAYGDKLVLDDLSLSFPASGMFAVLGPSGRGKTTLLRLIAGLETPQSGSVSVPKDARIAFCFQEDRLLPFKTVLQNVLLVCPDITAAKRWIERVGLAGEENSYPAALSGGMKRRAALARALAYDAPILLMDEPFRALDADMHAQMLALVREAAEGRLLILVTHDESDAAGMQIVRL